MAGLIVQLAISWLIVWLFDKRNLSVLGLFPTTQRLAGFLIFFLITSFCCATGFLLKIYPGNQDWVINPNLSVNMVLSGAWWNIKSVLFEELIFRGVLLFILIKHLGPTKAIIISAIAFGIYHWYSLGVIGNVIPMIVTFITTGIMGLLLAYGYAKTFSLYIPIGIHLGWNFTQIFVFSQGPIGNGIFVPVHATPFRTDSYLIFFCVTFLPMLLALSINFMLLKKYKQTEAGTKPLKNSMNAL